MEETCDVAHLCRNSPLISGNEAKCSLCRLCPGNETRDTRHFWSPTGFAKKNGRKKHPLLEAEKRSIKITSRINKIQKKRNRDPLRRKVLRKAILAEKTTERNIIHATQNSGRRNRDGDHIHKESITLDTKLQTTRENPVIQLAELEKVRADAMRSGKKIGGLVIRNKHNVGVVVFTEADYARLTKGFNE